MGKKLGKLLHDKILDQPWATGSAFDKTVAEYIGFTLVADLNTRVRWRIYRVTGKRLADIIYQQISEEIGSNAI